jgi:lysyl-tRNA synthetase class II
MTKKLSLNEEQQMKVEDINIKYAFQRLDMYEAIKKATNNGTTPPSDETRIKLREQMQKMKADKDNDFKAVLTPEQYEIYLKKRKD